MRKQEKGNWFTSKFAGFFNGPARTAVDDLEHFADEKEFEAALEGLRDRVPQMDFALLPGHHYVTSQPFPSQETATKMAEGLNKEFMTDIFWAPVSRKTLQQRVVMDPDNLHQFYLEGGFVATAKGLESHVINLCAQAMTEKTPYLSWQGGAGFAQTASRHVLSEPLPNNEVAFDLAVQLEQATGMTVEVSPEHQRLYIEDESFDLGALSRNDKKFEALPSAVAAIIKRYAPDHAREYAKRLRKATPEGDSLQIIRIPRPHPDRTLVDDMRDIARAGREKKQEPGAP